MVPDRNHPAYKQLVLGQNVPTLECLALKIMLGRIQLAVKSDSSAENVAKQMSAIYEFLVKNEQIAGRDIARIFTKAA